MNAKELKDLADSLFTKRGTLLSLWQEQAENFYPERADFTLRRALGTDFASGMMTSYPILCRRDLGDQIGQMLRPTAKEWAHVSLRDPFAEDNEAKRMLQWASSVQRRAMYDPVTLFTRATKEGDHDFAAFGQCAISVRLNKNNDALLYRTWHLRDMAWAENEEGKIGMIFRKWKPTNRDLVRLFGNRVHREVQTQNEAGKNPLGEVDCMHMIVEADLYDDKGTGKPWWSITYDCEHAHVIEAVNQWNREYVIPRWQTVSGSQYAYSPATIAALPDARLIQAMTYTLLEAGEKVVNPPLVATKDVVKSDMSVYAGGVTWVDRDYDERAGEALRPMTIDAKGMPLGVEMQKDSRLSIAAAFFLNKLTMPQRGPEMTAYEVGQRIQEYIRGALPIFEPMEMNYNGELCMTTWELLLRGGAFGNPETFPMAVRKAMAAGALQFRFQSPLHDAIEAQRGQKFMEVQSMVAQALAVDKTSVAVVDWQGALRDALDGIGAPAKWINDEAKVKQMVQGQQQAEQTQAMLEQMQIGADVANKLAGAQTEQAVVSP
jgi:hypothetical protein